MLLSRGMFIIWTFGSLFSKAQFSYPTLFVKGMDRICKRAINAGKKQYSALKTKHRFHQMSVAFASIDLAS